MRPPEAGPGALGERLFVWLQYLLPQHGISRLVRAASRVQTPWFKNLLTRGFLRLYSVDLAEAVETDPYAYGSFNDFFTRALTADARPPCKDAAAVASPVDGTVSECGRIDGGTLLQAKGRRYSLTELLAGETWAARFEGGSFTTIYLAPFNYHRVHMPVSGRLLDTVYVPGRLFSVNAATARYVPRLFARNERILMRFEGAAGQFAVVMVGALNVGSMATVWAGDVTPARRRAVTRLPPAAVALELGAELGRFNMGSTVILLFEPGRVAWNPDLRSGADVRVGRRIGSVA
jgi:phosphatidylserine decarboxylase